MVAPIRGPMWNEQPDPPQEDPPQDADRRGCGALITAFVTFLFAVFLLLGVLYAATKVVKSAWEG